ncbi:hypothetical protein [Streptomyces daghestanicus]|uniref:Uncharacterized protein n=1 Tax=Streptomyces daghestanicus TaxID=66885 RepID=A0ABQ3PYU5_9ACTN|nr:hypothetical protein [Streptomyces daghestanicus]GGU46995.1 hypothetical protein GCM10010259_42530 [Streptomyces daghestanicus]GHI30202.1 hypothetical protein Sdagh_19320 [Streptomyces daghestanicus]
MTEQAQSPHRSPRGPWTGATCTIAPEPAVVGHTAALTLALTPGTTGPPSHTGQTCTVMVTLPVGDSDTDLVSAGDARAVDAAADAEGWHVDGPELDGSRLRLTATGPPAALRLRLRNLRLNATAGTARCAVSVRAPGAAGFETLAEPEVTTVPVITGLRAKDVAIQKNATATYTWKITGVNTKDVTYSGCLAGPRMKPVYYSKDQLKPKVLDDGRCSWESPGLDDWVVMFFLTAHHGADAHCAATPVFVKDAAVEFGDLDAKGSVRIVHRAQDIFTELELIDSAEDQVAGTAPGDGLDRRRKVKGAVNGRDVDTYTELVFPYAGTATSDGLLTIAYTEDEGTACPSLLLEIIPPPPVHRTELHTRQNAAPLVAPLKEWHIQPDTTFTVPVLCGSSVTFHTPLYWKGTRKLTTQWHAMGGAHPLGGTNTSAGPGEEPE